MGAFGICNGQHEIIWKFLYLFKAHWSSYPLGNVEQECESKNKPPKIFTLKETKAINKIYQEMELTETAGFMKGGHTSLQETKE